MPRESNKSTKRKLAKVSKDKLEEKCTKRLNKFGSLLVQKICLLRALELRKVKE